MFISHSAAKKAKKQIVTRQTDSQTVNDPTVRVVSQTDRPLDRLSHCQIDSQQSDC